MSAALPALSDLSVTEFLTLVRIGYMPLGLVIGSSVYEANTTQGVSLWDALFNPVAAAQVPTGEVVALSEAVRAARALAIQRLRSQAAQFGAEGVVGVRLELEHHQWRGGHQIARFVAMGTAVATDPSRLPEELRGAPPLRLANGTPFTSDLSGQDFVSLLRAGYRPVTVCSGTCIYQLDQRVMAQYQGQNAEIGPYTQAFFDARETAMARLQYDLFTEFPIGHPDAPVGIVGMEVTEKAHRQPPAQALRVMQQSLGPWFGVPVVEFTALGTAIAPLAAGDPRRSAERPRPRIVVPLDR